ncbi:MAG: UvrD-helicase domain-containing protein [Acidobacteria bacterium]|nr:UvrD-helicase domain-containing protein [Acidobacteriota bacterium]
MSNSRATDTASRDTIRERLLENLLVEAGAGSGKTQMLAERMAAGVATGAYQVEHMAAVTFTRKAASELRGRFHLALEAALKSARAADPARIARLEAALSNLERFFAGTIHSFCARLLRERPVESGVAPGFSELDEVQDLELRQRVWRDFITSTRAAGDPEMLALLDADIKPKDLDDAFGKVCDNDDVEFPPGDAACPDSAAAWQALQAFWQTLHTHLPSTIDPATTCDIQQAALAFSGQLRVSQRRRERPSVVAALLSKWDRKLKVTQKYWAPSKVEAKRVALEAASLHEQFRADVAGPYLAQWRQYVYRLAIGLLTRARHNASDERRRLNVLNYGDLLTLTATVLRNNVDVRRALQQKYRHLLVDEFQDTDPVQAEICFWLAEDGAAPPDAPPATPTGASRDWRQVPLRPGALFVVGDPKQSIYRFRRADIDIYNVVRQRFSEPGVGRVLPLTRNFRSAPRLCEWANTVFATRFPAAPTAQAPRFASLDADESKAVEGEVVTLTHACDRNEVHTHDAAAIARYIRSEVAAGHRRFSDFLILTRKRKHVGDYADALEALNIPVEVSGAGAFGASREVRALTVLLRALADREDPVALIAVLRGPLFGISDPQLFAFRQRGGWFSVYHDAETAADTDDPVVAALSALRQYVRWTQVLPAAGALERILEHSGYLALAAITPGGVDAGDVVHAVDRVRQVVEAGGSLADAADALDADVDATSEVESLPLEPGRTDVVRLMNLHKAKGLEANVVFLADPLGSVKPGRVDVHIERTGLHARGWLKLVRKSETSWAEPLLGQHADWPDHEATELPYLNAEEDRLLYVAATRAREMLVVSRWAEKPADGAWGVLAAFLQSAPELPLPGAVVVPPVAALESSPATQTDAEQARSAAHARTTQPSWAATSVTAEAHHIARMTRSVDAEADDPSKVVVASTPSHRADAGQAWGTLVHGLLEHAMRHQTATRDDLRRLAMWLTAEEPQLRVVIDEALDTVQAVAAGTFWAEAKAAPECHEEVPFAVRDQTNGVSTVLTGVIDLVHRTPEGWKVVDYKTDRDGADSLPAKYAEQIAQYEAAWRTFVPEQVTSVLVSTRTEGPDQ